MNKKIKTKTSAIILCAGSSTRFKGDKNKLVCQTFGEKIAKKTVQTFLDMEEIDQIIVALPKDNEELLSMFKNSDKVKTTFGGDSRFMSVYLSLKEVDLDTDIVLIHDGARPYVNKDIILDSIKSAKEFGSGVCGNLATDTLRRIENGILKEVVDRSKTVSIQTPQTFRAESIKSAYEKAFLEKDASVFTDDSSVYSKYIGECRLVNGTSDNVKITFVEDLKKEPKFGVGYDIHKFVEGKELFLCGEKIDFDKGLLAHSDGDVPIHALMDSILSAIGKKDIGHFFPDTDMNYKNIDSKILLKKVVEILEQEGGKVLSVTLAIVCESPRLSPYIDKMKSTLSSILKIDKEKVGITVTTNEGVPMSTMGDSIACYATSVVC